MCERSFLPLGFRCSKVLFNKMTKSHGVKEMTCSIRPYSVSCSSNYDTCAAPNRYSSFLKEFSTTTQNSVSSRSRHHLASDDKEIQSPVLEELEFNSPLLPTQSQYCIRIGNKLEPSVAIFDGSEPLNLKVNLQVIDADGLELDNIRSSSYSAESCQSYRKRADSFLKQDTIVNFTFRSDDPSGLTCSLSLCHGDGTFLGRCYISLERYTLLSDVMLPLINETDTIIGLVNCSVLEIRGLGQPEYLPARGEEPAALLEIGHRGCGVTHTDRQLFDTLPCLPENTVASMETAWRHGAHMVETDVVVTQDLKAVLHHDLEILVSTNKRVPINHVTSHVLETQPVESLEGSQEEIRDQCLLDQGDATLPSIKDKCSPFPYLSEVLQTLPHGLGVMLEVKVDIRERMEEPRVAYHSDKNVYIDVILNDLFRYAGERNIILCSFCVDVCTLLKNKQNQWPVILITQGSTEIYPDYLDKRLNSLDRGINAAIAENLQGVSMFSKLLLEDSKTFVDRLTEAGLKSYVWGVDCTRENFRKEMRRNKVDGVIYDRIYDNKDLPKNKLT